MKIAIVGAGISGLAAGRELAKAGHEVIVLEKSRGFGGRMATRYAGEDLKLRIDHGATHFTAHHPDFKALVDELALKGLVQPWGDAFRYHTGHEFLLTDPVAETATWTSTQGMNRIGRHLARLCDVRLQAKVGGLTYFGANRGRKRAWMVNLSTSEVLEADAVILSAPAPQAMGILGMTQDETDTLKMIREIDAVTYSPSLTYLLHYQGADVPGWQGVECENSPISFLSNESAKRGETGGLTLTIHAAPDFSKRHLAAAEEVVRAQLLDALGGLIGSWAASPTWAALHRWRYAHCENPLGRPFMERGSADAPLALVGDCMLGSTVELAYRSGFELGRHWAERFANRSSRNAA